MVDLLPWRQEITDSKTYNSVRYNNAVGTIFFGKLLVFSDCTMVSRGAGKSNTLN